MNAPPLPMGEPIELRGTEPYGLLVKCLDYMDASALPFAHETVVQLDRYMAAALQLPTTLEQTCKYLDYRYTSEPELSPSQMLELFNMLRQHSAGWLSLRTQCSALASALVNHAETIQALGIEVERLARTMRAIGDASLTWETLSQLPPVGLSNEDKVILTSMASLLAECRLKISSFDKATKAVCTGFELFRDEVRLKLIPTVQEKARALRRQPGINPGNSFFLEFITNVLDFASNDDVKQLLSLVERLDQTLSTAVVSSGKIHSVWQAIDTYLESSANRLNAIDTQQRLAMFMLYFKLFSSQWEGIQRHANATLSAFR
ncbi:hypothetical protein [Pseudomonas sp.]|uniref:hypothetical protein n=1 Tax=Pseudomonas sp. TaxID=306 RepID=UPI0031D0D6AF